MGFSYVILTNYFFFQDLERLKESLLVYLFSHFFVFFSKLFLRGDIETNPGPRRNLNNPFTICHWKLSCIYVHNFAKVQLLKTYLAVNKFDIVCLSERYLNTSCPLMMTTWTYLAISGSGLIIQLIFNLEVYVCVIKTVYH